MKTVRILYDRLPYLDDSKNGELIEPWYRVREVGVLVYVDPGDRVIMLVDIMGNPMIEASDMLNSHVAGMQMDASTCRIMADWLRAHLKTEPN